MRLCVRSKELNNTSTIGNFYYIYILFIKINCSSFGIMAWRLDKYWSGLSTAKIGENKTKNRSKLFWQDIIRLQLSKWASCDFVKKVYMYRQDAYSEYVTRYKSSIQWAIKIYIHTRVYCVCVHLSLWLYSIWFSKRTFNKRPLTHLLKWNCDFNHTDISF